MCCIYLSNVGYSHLCKELAGCIVVVSTFQYNHHGCIYLSNVEYSQQREATEKPQEVVFTFVTPKLYLPFKCWVFTTSERVIDIWRLLYLPFKYWVFTTIPVTSISRYSCIYLSNIGYSQHILA